MQALLDTVGAMHVAALADLIGDAADLQRMRMRVAVSDEAADTGDTHQDAFVAQLAREGARWMIVRGSQCSLLDHCDAGQNDVQTYIRGLSEGMTNPNNIVVSSPAYSGCAALSNAPGCTVAVTVTYPFNFLLPYLPVGTLNMSSTSKMVISQ